MDGVYRARFSTPLGAGYGVVTAAGGVITGGDSRSFYVGTYALDAEDLVVELAIKRHNRRVILPSVLGARQAKVQADGRFRDGSARLSGFALAKIPVKIDITIDRIADIPAATLPARWSRSLS
jgi:hypothetical protein